MDTVIMKLGGSIITRKSSSTPKLDRANLARIAMEIASSKLKNLILINGAGSFGHPIVKKHGLVAGFKRKSQILPLAKDQALMNELNVLVCNELIKNSIPAYPFEYASGSVTESGNIKSMSVDLLKGMIKLGVVPVLYGTPAIDRMMGFSIISGDRMMGFLSSRLDVKKTIFATNVDGIYDINPSKNGAKLLKKLTRKQLLSIAAEGSAHTDVTGGMKGKISNILSMKDLKCQVINGNTPGNIRKALAGDEKIGTVITL